MLTEKRDILKFNLLLQKFSQTTSIMSEQYLMSMTDSDKTLLFEISISMKTTMITRLILPSANISAN
jgi:hypothetical protein